MVFDPSFAGARPTTTCDWFSHMFSLKTIMGLSYLNTSEVTYMGRMFVNCKKMKSLDLSSFNTSKVTNMGDMFYACDSLTSLDLSSFNTSKVIYMNGMFHGSTHLQTIYVSNDWSTAAVTSSNNMFYACRSLVGGQGTTYSYLNPDDKTYAHIDGGTSNPGYFTEKPKEAYAWTCGLLPTSTPSRNSNSQMSTVTRCGTTRSRRFLIRKPTAIPLSMMATILSITECKDNIFGRKLLVFGLLFLAFGF